MVDQVVPHDDLTKVSTELAERIAAGAPIAMELTKYGVYRGLETNIRMAIDYESYAENVCFNTEDHIEGVKSFFEKRRAEFKGR